MSRRYRLLIIAAVFVFTLFFSSIDKIYAEEDLNYGHISFVDEDAFVLKPGEDRDLKAMVNLPLVPGDIIYTGSGGRCEIQFDNGTLIRLDKNTELKIETILAKSITTKDKITTLQLKKGCILTMNQVYNKEIFQVLTPTGAIKMIKRSKNLLKVNKDGETQGFVERGKIGVICGKDHKSDEKQFVGAGKGFLITKDYDFKPDVMEKNIAFAAWNKYLNKNFKELHYGKSNVPEVIYRRSPGIVHFAEKWSTRYGEWEYNELFGYVWKPYDDIFHNKRPFWDANYVRINGEMVLVPNQPWGWAPAHLGTWFFSKTYGWIWIPGDAFSRGICSIGLWPLECCDMFGMFGYCYRNGGAGFYSFNSLGYWVNYMFGSKYLYLTYRIEGRKAWAEAYAKKFGMKDKPGRPFLDGVPDNIKKILKIMKKTNVEQIKTHFTFDRRGNILKFENSKIIEDVKFDRSKSQFITRETINISGVETVKIDDLISYRGHDWNPDSKWASKVGVTIRYSSKENSVICPKLNISSKDINDFQRSSLRRSVVDRSYLQIGSFGNSGAPGSNSGYSSNSSVNTGAGKTLGSGSSGSSSGGSTSSSTVEK